MSNQRIFNGMKIECDACDATGIYRGFAEPEGVGVVCLKCDGTGCVTLNIRVKPFTERKRRADVKIVQISRGAFVATGVGPMGNGVSYQDWLKGKGP